MRSRNRSESIANSGRDRRGSVRSGSIRASEDSQSRSAPPVSYDLSDGSGECLNDEAIGVLDVVDPQVSTGTPSCRFKSRPTDEAVNHLQNISNTLVFPHLPALWSRRPEVVLDSAKTEDDRE
jgi:hypothetical protein